MKYVVTMELKECARGTQNEEDFIPVLICREEEVREIVDMCFHDPNCEADIVDIRIATQHDIDNYPHYYC